MSFDTTYKKDPVLTTFFLAGCSLSALEHCYNQHLLPNHSTIVEDTHALLHGAGIIDSIIESQHNDVMRYVRLTEQLTDELAVVRTKGDHKDVTEKLLSLTRDCIAKLKPVILSSWDEIITRFEAEMGKSPLQERVEDDIKTLLDQYLLD